MTHDQTEALIQERVHVLRTFLGQPAAVAFGQVFHLAQLAMVFAAASSALRESDPQEHGKLAEAFNLLVNRSAEGVFEQAALPDGAKRKVLDYVVLCLEAATAANADAPTKH